MKLKSTVLICVGSDADSSHFHFAGGGSCLSWTHSTWLNFPAWPLSVSWTTTVKKEKDVLMTHPKWTVSETCGVSLLKGNSQTFPQTKTSHCYDWFMVLILFLLYKIQLLIISFKKWCITLVVHYYYTLCGSERARHSVRVSSNLVKNFVTGLVFTVLLWKILDLHWNAQKAISSHQQKQVDWSTQLFETKPGGI